MNTGSGIGLHLVKGYMDLHKGEITVESTPGKGTCFTLLLPAQPPQTAASDSQAAIGGTLPDTEKATESPVSEGNKVTVLVAEDNEQFRTFMKDLLGQDFTVLTAADGQEGLAMAREYGPDLIISDVMMPHMDGYAFCRAVKDDVQCCHIPFILLTAKTLPKAGAGHTKPVPTRLSPNRSTSTCCTAASVSFWNNASDGWLRSGKARTSTPRKSRLPVWTRN